jgi:sigma-B regulation protein RsbU (phosphoserine phosphatase)
MFVTLICGILDTDTGEIRYANAGHNPPLHIKGDRSVEYVQAAPFPMAGIMDDCDYSEHTLQLHRGETLLIYTDGITEALNMAEELYSEERLERDLTELAGEPGQTIISGLADKVRAFAGNAPQSDDMTMLSLTYTGKDYDQR